MKKIKKVGNAAGKTPVTKGKAKRPSPTNRGSSSRYARNNTKQPVVN